MPRELTPREESAPGAPATTASPDSKKTDGPRSRGFIRPLESLAPSDEGVLGAEVRDLAILRAAQVAVARGIVASFHSEPSEVSTRLAEALADELSVSTLPASATTASGVSVKLRPWFRTMALGARAEPRWPALADATTEEEVDERVRAAFDAMRTPSMSAALSMSPDGIALRAVFADPGPFGFACSVDPEDGDPATVVVWLPDRRPFRVDRKTMRPVDEEGSSKGARGALSRTLLARVADLVDRAQLALGRPVEIDWVTRGGRPVVARVRPARVNWRYSEETWRMVTLLWHDEGPIAPLSVDALDKALREETDTDEVRVRRAFARAYRRLEPGRARRGERRHPFMAAATRAAETISDVARPIAAVRAFTKTLDERLLAFDRDDLSRLAGPELSRALRERQRVVIEAYQLLDRGRKATAAVLSALEATLGSVPRECIEGLAALRRTRARRRLDERLARVAKELGELPEDVDPVPARWRRAFAELRAEFAGKRPLGLDVRAASYGSSDAALIKAMRVAQEGRAERAEGAQRQAIRRLMATARARPLGRGRAALARTLTLMIERLADAKGQVAEGLADANQRQRDVALEIGRRLVEQGVLDEPEDALFLHANEIQEALSGEPGAYTARVRLRREEDDRWREFIPPTRIAARPRPQRPSWRDPTPSEPE